MFTTERRLKLAHAIQDAHKLLKALEKRVWNKETGMAAVAAFDSDQLLTLVSFIHSEAEELRVVQEE